MKTTIEFKRVNNDINGNPRDVCHFLPLINDQDEEKAKELSDVVRPYQMSVSHLYDIAVSKAHKIGGKKYRGKDFGGGIVFQSYNIEETEEAIIKAKG